MTLLTFVFAYLFVVTPVRAADDVAPQLPTPYCDAHGVRARAYTKAERRETRERVQEVCKQVGASKPVCAYLDAIVVRESSGRSGVRHTIGSPEHGVTENGLGAMGLSLRWHADKWPGDDEDPMFCVPEVSAIVALDIVHRAVKKWGANSLTEVQAVYGGQFGCSSGRERLDPWRRAFNRISAALSHFGFSFGTFRPKVKRTCGLHVTPRTVRVCRRLERYDVDCWAEIGEEDIGELPPMISRRELAARLHAKYEREQEQ